MPLRPSIWTGGDGGLTRDLSARYTPPRRDAPIRRVFGSVGPPAADPPAPTPTGPVALWTATLTVGSFQGGDRLGRNATQGDLVPDTPTIDGEDVEIPHLFHDDSEARIVVNTRSGEHATILSGRWIVIGDMDPFELRREGTTTRAEAGDDRTGYDQTDPWTVGEELTIELYDDDPDADDLPDGTVWRSTLTVGGDTSDESGFGSSYGQLTDTVLVAGTGDHRCAIRGLGYSVGDGAWFLYTISEDCGAGLEGLWLKVGDMDAFELANRLTGATSGFSEAAPTAPGWAIDDELTLTLHESNPDA